MHRETNHIINAAAELGLLEWFASTDPPYDRGYTFWTHPNLMAISNHALVALDHHSGYSFSMCCRRAQMILKLQNK